MDQRAAERRNMNQFVDSNYPRKENDDYRTIDPRCVDAFLDVFDYGLNKDTLLVDVCQ